MCNVRTYYIPQQFCFIVHIRIRISICMRQSLRTPGFLDIGHPHLDVAWHHLALFCQFLRSYMTSSWCYAGNIFLVAHPSIFTLCIWSGMVIGQSCCSVQKTPLTAAQCLIRSIAEWFEHLACRSLNCRVRRFRFKFFVASKRNGAKRDLFRIHFACSLWKFQFNFFVSIRFFLLPIFRFKW
jgi:hypothetical protein